MRPLPIFLALALLSGCYGDPELPPAPTPAPAGDPAEGRPTPAPQPSTQTFRMEQMSAVLGRLAGSADKPAAERDGIASWRPPELEKLHELLLECCRGNSATCRRCGEAIGAARLPTEELWPLAGRFAGPLRPTAGAGLPPLLLPLLLDGDGSVRDRALRLLVGTGAIERGAADAQGRRAAAVPRAPAAGEPVWLILEQPAPCSEGTAQVKGPDASGRIDVALSWTCEAPETPAFPPKVHRVVWAQRLAAMPASGLSLHAGGAPQPLLRLIRPPEKADDPAGR